MVASEKGGNWEIERSITTGVGTETMDFDNTAHKIYLPTAEFEGAKPGSRPAAKPETFIVVVVGLTAGSAQRSVAGREKFREGQAEIWMAS